MVNNVKITDVESFLKELKNLNLGQEDKMFYRGHSNVEYKLLPSIFRDEKKSKEAEIYNIVMTECSNELADFRTHNEILSKMQHYDIPTRLLDVTTNALVALYFACYEESEPVENNGIVYIIKSNMIKNYDSDVVSILSTLPRFNEKDQNDMKMLAQEYLKNNKNRRKNLDKFNSKKL